MSELPSRLLAKASFEPSAAHAGSMSTAVLLVRRVRPVPFVFTTYISLFPSAWETNASCLAATQLTLKVTASVLPLTTDTLIGCGLVISQFRDTPLRRTV